MAQRETRALLAVRRLRIQYPLRGELRWPWQLPAMVRAVDGVDFDLLPGQTLGIVGESGCGKSTLARALVGLQPISAGAIEYAGTPLTELDTDGMRRFRRDVQLVFQDAVASLDPRMPIAASVAEPLRALCPELDRAARERRVTELLERVGLPVRLHAQYPHALSGGQCQRVALARALAVGPRVLVCDEAVSALDVSVQAQIVNLLAELRAELGMAVVFIAHDLAVVRHLCERIFVMYLGRMVEQAPTEPLFRSPLHPYTQALLSSASDDASPPVGADTVIAGDTPGPSAPPPGCVFASRCPMVDDRCMRSAPHLRRVSHGGFAACHFVGIADAAA